MELSEILDNIDIVEYISQFTELTERNGEWWGLSPFKDEKTPSFSVREETKRFFDFSSGIGGNCLTFTKFYYNCSASEAVKKLADYLGCDSNSNTHLNKLSATSMCKKYKKDTTTKKESTQVTKFRNDIMESYEINDKLQVWINEGISEDALKKFNVRYDAFSDRLIYPIYDSKGNIVNIGGRTLDPEWKEKGLRKYTYFSGWGGQMSVVYGLFENIDEIKEKQEIILFEGAKSVMMAYGWGIKNTGAILTSHLNPGQMKILARLGVHVVFALDKDVDVTKDHNINKLKQYANVEIIRDTENLLSDKDSPVDRGIETFTKLYESRYRFR